GMSGAVSPATRADTFPRRSLGRLRNESRAHRDAAAREDDELMVRSFDRDEVGVVAKVIAMRTGHGGGGLDGELVFEATLAKTRAQGQPKQMMRDRHL